MCSIINPQLEFSFAQYRKGVPTYTYCVTMDDVFDAFGKVVANENPPTVMYMSPHQYEQLMTIDEFGTVECCEEAEPGEEEEQDEAAEYPLPRSEIPPVTHIPSWEYDSHLPLGYLDSG